MHKAPPEGADDSAYARQTAAGCVPGQLRLLQFTVIGCLGTRVGEAGGPDGAFTAVGPRGECANQLCDLIQDRSSPAAPPSACTPGSNSSGSKRLPPPLPGTVPFGPPSRPTQSTTGLPGVTAELGSPLALPGLLHRDALLHRRHQERRHLIHAPARRPSARMHGLRMRGYSDCSRPPASGASRGGPVCPGRAGPPLADG